ncbi:hypothetical protein MTR67_007795, partial [Solanum verrucosum]
QQSWSTFGSGNNWWRYGEVVLNYVRVKSLCCDLPVNGKAGMKFLVEEFPGALFGYRLQEFHLFFHISDT